MIESTSKTQEENWAQETIKLAKETAIRCDSSFSKGDRSQKVDIFIQERMIDFPKNYETTPWILASEIIEEVQKEYPENTKLIEDSIALRRETMKRDTPREYHNYEKDMELLRIFIEKYSSEVAPIVKRVHKQSIEESKRAFRQNLIDRTRIAAQGILSRENSLPELNDEFGGQPVRSRLASAVKNGVNIRPINRQTTNEIFDPTNDKMGIVFQTTNDGETVISIRKRK